MPDSHSPGFDYNRGGRTPRPAPSTGTRWRPLPLAVAAALGVVMAVLTPVAVAQPAQQPAGSTIQSLPTVEVTATRIPEPAFNVPTSISVITSKEIQHGPPGKSLAQTLARVPGLVAQPRESLAQDLQLSIRGFGSQASFGVQGIRLLVDGLPYSLPNGQGQTDPFPPLAIVRRIEVLRGPFSVLYGNAAGGVIQLFTKNGPRQPEVSGHVMFGSYGSMVKRLQAGGTAGKVNYMADLSWFQTRGYREHSAAKRDNLYTKFQYKPNDQGTLTFILDGENQPFAEDPSSLTAAEVAADPRQARSAVFKFGSGEFHRHREGGVVYEQKLGADNRLHATAWLGSRRVVQFLPFAGTGLDSGGAVVDLHNDSGGGGARWSHQAQLAGFPLKMTLGFDYQQLHEHRKGFVNAGSIDGVRGSEGALRRNEYDIASRLGEYLQARWTLGRWQINGGIRHSQVKLKIEDHFLQNGDDSGIRNFSKNPGFVGVLYKLTPRVNLYASYGRGFATPTLDEVLYLINGGAGLNFNLVPSTSNNYQTGVKADFGSQGKIRFAVYKIDTNDEIVNATYFSGRTTYQNADTTRKGAELSVSDGLGHGLHGYLAWNWLQADFASGPFDGKRMPGVPGSTLYGALAWTYAPLGFRVLADAQFRSHVFADDDNTASASSYLVANLQAGLHQQVDGWRFGEFAQLNNLFDRHYIGAVVINATNENYFEPAPNRNYMVGVSARYSF